MTGPGATGKDKVKANRLPMMRRAARGHKGDSEIHQSRSNGMAVRDEGSTGTSHLGCADKYVSHRKPRCTAGPEKDVEDIDASRSLSFPPGRRL